MSDDVLKHPRAELRAATRALESMKEAKSLEEFESEWQEFLSRLERVWTKVERSCQAIRGKFQPWQARYHRLRKTDMLLRYLKNARDADTHSIQSITQVQPGSMAVRFANRQGGYIKHMEVRGGKMLAYEGDPIVVTQTPPQPVAVRVKNNGEWFNPPTSHLDNPIEIPPHPVLLAELGLKFYEGFVNDVEHEFFRKAL